MNENILESFFEKIKNQQQIEYPADIQTDLIEVAKKELLILDIPFETHKSRKNVLNLFHDSSSPYRYTKGFYPNNERISRDICKDKFITQKFLENANIKTPIGKQFDPTMYSEALSYIKGLPNVSFVLKPVSMSMSLGAFLNVNEYNLQKAWTDSFNIQGKYKVKSPKVLIQEQIYGLEIRVIIVEGQIGNAVFRAPGNIIGDGKSTIEELINLKNNERMKHNYLKRNLLTINDNLIQNLTSKNLTLSSVLSKNEICILYSQSSIATGREVYEISQYLHPNILHQALESVVAIPGLHTAGIDIFVESLDSTEGTVIEVNTNPAFQLHYYPMTGEKFNPLKRVFKSYYTDRKMISGDFKLEDLTSEDFELIKERYRFLYNKQKSISDAHNMYFKKT